HTFDQRYLLHDGVRIAENQRSAATRSHSHPVARAAASFDPNEVIAQALQLVFNAAAPRIPNRNHANERAYAYCYPKDGEHTPNPITIQGNECLAEDGLEIHELYEVCVRSANVPTMSASQPPRKTVPRPRW